MKRREFIALFGSVLAVGVRAADAQTTTKSYHLAGVFPGGVMDDNNQYMKLLLPSLQKRGYTRGQNLIVEPPGQRVPLGDVFQRLKGIKVDVVVVVGYPTAVAAKASGIPAVVASGAGDPVATGLVNSLSRPGGNITGISDVASTLSTKRLQLLKEMSPNLRRVAMLWNKDDLGMSLRYQASATAAQELGVTVQPLGVREPNDFDEAFTAMNGDPPDAILMVSDSLTLLNRKRVFDYALEHKIPAIYEAEYIARDGGLMSYGADQRESLDRAADMADRILKGAKPADLPFEEPTRYLFVINVKTAKAMGLTIPNALLALADEVIE
jgi:putative tryptophan/tyrosine transport system substrate-binding protein